MGDTRLYRSLAINGNSAFCFQKLRSFQTKMLQPQLVHSRTLARLCRASSHLVNSQTKRTVTKVTVHLVVGDTRPSWISSTLTEFRICGFATVCSICSLSGIHFVSFRPQIRSDFKRKFSSSKRP